MHGGAEVQVQAQVQRCRCADEGAEVKRYKGPADVVHSRCQVQRCGGG